MPCYEMRQAFKQTVEVEGKEFYQLDPENVFAKAVESELARQGIRVMSEVRMYKNDTLAVQVDMVVKDQWGNATRSREVVELKIDELHDMALKFQPPRDPNKPLTFAEMARHFHPNAPKDLSDKPLGPMKRKFVEVKTIDGYAFKEVWEFKEPKPEETPEEAPKAESMTMTEAKKQIYKALTGQDL